jgi:hypothetical protein
MSTATPPTISPTQSTPTTAAAPSAPRPPREKQRAPERFGYVEFYGWSEDKSRQVHADEGSEFGAMVRSRGFTLD